MVRSSARRRPLREVAIVCAPVALCPVVALVAPGSPDEAVARAEAIVRLEQRLGLFFETDAHRWALEHPVLLAVASALYLGTHVSALVGALVLAWYRAPAIYRIARDTFVVAQLLTVAGYLAFPTAPPRLVPGLGLTDTLTAAVGTGSAGVAYSFQYRFAALPSGHVVFALVAGATVAVVARRRWVRAAAAIYPALVVVLVVTTANHFWLDAAAGTVVAVAATTIVVRRCRSRVEPDRSQPAMSSEAATQRSVHSISSAVGSASPSSTLEPVGRR